MCDLEPHKLRASFHHFWSVEIPEILSLHFSVLPTVPESVTLSDNSQPGNADARNSFLELNILLKSNALFF